MSSTVKGWLIGAAVTAAFAFYTGFVNEHGVYDWNATGGPRFRYTCGSVWNSEYPKDGKGPCTDILADAQWVPWLWVAATAGLLITAWVKSNNESQA